LNNRKPPKREIKQSLELMGVMSGKLDVSDCKYLGKQPQRRKQHEGLEQAALFQWARLNENKYPELRLLFHIPNGGKRDMIEGAHLKAQGVKAGVPDIFLAYPNKRYHGLFIELKAQGGRVQETQKQWLEVLAAQGYNAVVAYGFDEARAIVEEYLKDERKSQNG